MITGTAYLLSVTGWLEQHLLTCPSRKYFHVQCPGCGLQRSCIALMRGEWALSFSLYPATIPLLCLLALLGWHLVLPLKNGAVWIKWMQICTAIIIFISYLLKIIHHQISA